MYDLQHSFPKERSYETQLIMLVEDLARNAGFGKRIDLTLFYFSKAFDKVNHSKLMETAQLWNMIQCSELDTSLPWRPENRGLLFGARNLIKSP